MKKWFFITVIFCSFILPPMFGWSFELENYADMKIAVGPGGDVFVNINNSHRVVRYTSDGVPIGAWNLELLPSAIATGPDGSVYVTINNSHRVVRYDPVGNLMTYWDAPDILSSIAVGPDGSVYVTINNNHRVVRYDPNGNPLGEWVVE